MAAFSPLSSASESDERGEPTTVRRPETVKVWDPPIPKNLRTNDGGLMPGMAYLQPLTRVRHCDSAEDESAISICVDDDRLGTEAAARASLQ